jgi:hypothetical protein
MGDLFDRAKDISLNYIRTWLPGGYEESGQWVVKNPMRIDNRAGSFKINLFTGAWNDYADEDAVGHDTVSLFAYLNGLSNYEAAKEILKTYDPDYFPNPGDIKKSDTWHQLSRGAKQPPVLLIQENEIARWPLEINVGQTWRVIMWIVRFRFEDKKKIDLPYTLWSDTKNIEWRRNALKNVKYPLYGYQRLIEFPNAPVVLYEGQKVPSVIQPILGDDWVCVGWYGGAGNSHLTDFSPLTGREIYYCFDADGAGRKSISKILDDIHTAVHLIFPPSNVAKGWDHADAVIEENWKKEDILKILKGEIVPILHSVPYIGLSPENRPTRLENPVSPDFKEFILSSIFVWEGDTRKVMNGWFFWIVEVDASIHNCIKYDYTTGTKTTAYDSTDIFEANLEHRLQNCGIPANMVTKTVIERLCKEVIRYNDKFNRVADYMDMLKTQYPNVSESILNEFMTIFTFNIEKNINEDGEEYAKRCDKIERLYKELFHIFFVRMHAHINGTRKKDDGNFVGLLENDIVPILEGPQNIGKTTLCRWLACDDELYIDLGSGLKQGFGSAETVKKVRGRLIAEIGEMKIMKNTESLEMVKSFISMKAATVDIKYVENQKDIPMTVSFIGTSNPEQYLSDETGNRRFWPVKLTKIDIEFLDKNKELAYKIHSYYSKYTSNMKMDKIYFECRPSAELNEFMEELRESALITYSDYEVVLKMIRIWKSTHMLGGQIDQSEVELMANEHKYPMRISQRSFKRAVENAGFKHTRRYDKEIDHCIAEWVYEPKGIIDSMGIKEEEPPF